MCGRDQGMRERINYSLINMYLHKVLDDDNIVLCGASTQHSLPLSVNITVLHAHTHTHTHTHHSHSDSNTHTHTSPCSRGSEAALAMTVSSSFLPHKTLFISGMNSLFYKDTQ